MLRYGFELEGFVEDNGVVTIPQSDFPVDGFPGLVELRTTDGASLEESYSGILRRYLHLPKKDGITVNFSRHEHKFSGADMQKLRAHAVFDKQLLNVKNIYGRSPRRLGNKTLAAFQINISNEIAGAWTDSNGKHHSPRYGLVDVHHIVSRLDEEFETEIKATNRQPGMYAIKDYIRLEYRSLPNSVFQFAVDGAEQLIARIKHAVENE